MLDDVPWYAWAAGGLAAWYLLFGATGRWLRDDLRSEFTDGQMAVAWAASPLLVAYALVWAAVWALSCGLVTPPWIKRRPE